MKRIFLAGMLSVALAACGNPTVEIAELDGVNGTNNTFRIKIDPRSPCPRATFAQEFYEARAKRDPVRAVAIRVDSSAQRSMEVASHEIEVQAAVKYCAVEAESYRSREAAAMHNGYAGLFKGTPIAEIEARMKSETRAALRWLDKNKNIVEGFKL